MELGRLLGIQRELPGVEPITKTQFGCFRCPEFVVALAALQKNFVVLTGIEAHICVMQTALGALPRHGVHAVTDAMSSRSADDWEVAVKRMMQSGVTIYVYGNAYLRIAPAGWHGGVQSCA